MDIIRAIEQQQIKSDLPEFHVGDNVKVHYRIKEGDRERIHLPRDLHRPQDQLRRWR